MIKMNAPCNRDPGLKTYVKAVGDDIQQSLDQDPRYCPHDNLTSQERKALFSLRSRSDIMIKLAEKLRFSYGSDDETGLLGEGNELPSKR